jgi:hypothetical protein
MLINYKEQLITAAEGRSQRRVGKCTYFLRHSHTLVSARGNVKVELSL